MGFPIRLRLGVEPYGHGKVLADPFQPGDARLPVVFPIIDIPARREEFVRIHAGIPHHHHMKGVSVTPEELFGGDPFPSGHIGVDLGVDAIMKVVMLELLKVSRGMGRGKKGLGHFGIDIHTAAHIHQEKELGAVFSRRLEDELDLARIFTGLVDGLFDHQLFIVADSIESSQAF